VQQAVVLDGLSLDSFSPFQNGLPASRIDIGRPQIADTLMVSAVVAILDKVADLGFDVTAQEVVLEQDPVLL
jgi:hypothetical protein